MSVLTIVLLAFKSMIPITLAAIGEVFGERAGVINIGLEGIMVVSAFMAVVGAQVSGSPTVGVLAGMVAGAAIGLLHGIISVYLRGNQVISGVGINLFGLGIVGAGIYVLWGGPLQLPVDLQIPSFSVFGGKVSPLVPITILLALFTWWMLNKTSFGLKVRAVGEKPEAADVAGVQVKRLRFIATIYAATLGGLAGAFLSLGWSHTITKTLPAGRGFIALANVVFSGLNPLLTLVGGFIFGFFDALAMWISNVPAINRLIPYQFVRMIPYIVTLLVVAGAIGRARFPARIGEPYRRE